MNSEFDLQDGLKELLEDVLAVALGEMDENEISVPIQLDDLIRVEDFRDAEVLTRDAGLVIRFKDGAEYQLSIVRSR